MTNTANPYSHNVPVVSRSGQALNAIVGPADYDDLPLDWKCDWQAIWEASYFECQAIVKLTFGETVWGLMRYSLYPYPAEPGQSPSFLLIDNIEAHPERALVRDSEAVEPSLDPWVDPVGRWLIWHACQVALDYCSPRNSPLVTLAATRDAVDYYQETIGMSYKGSASGAPGEDNHAFIFNKREAKDFCTRQVEEYGQPRQVT